MFGKDTMVDPKESEVRIQGLELNKMLQWL